ncbi:hypothetical protein BDB00DRAFT_877478 [Zychaea mexicana]|uniref:uncharacterized protein n=1 Tax=Zychaea mexicana TaxID=64656 RepID=UPI0022FDF799|nr:uncharacterized protein BDB00DRAFT_877478 [Zychaea mexicana]KAI9488415.1 hypothetical protein BDB00DRAFT_877478 [Zychaea mexicana]
MQRLTFVFALVAALTANVHASSSSSSSSAYDDLHQLFKRDAEKLPYDTLPDTNCTQPTACSSISQPVSECRCSPLLTICRNDNGEFCWGSQTLNQDQGCPAAPDSCSSANLNGTSSCLCNSDTVLCVDNYRHYCYGSYEGSGAQASVSVQAFPSDGAAPSSAASDDASSNESNESSASSITASFLGTAAVVGTVVSLSL